MHRLRKSTVLSLAFTITAVLCEFSPLRAQSGTTAQAHEQTASTTTKPQAGPKGCPTGKMRCLTAKDRWAAAIRNADRRAAYARTHGGKVK